MRNRFVAIIFALALMLAVSAQADSAWECNQCGRRVQASLGDICPYCGARRHVHTWREATYTEPKTCIECGATEGAPLPPTQADEQFDALLAAQSLLEEKEQELAAQATQIAAQQLQIDTQKEQLEDQQLQIEQLVGVRTRLISDLSEALRAANISAVVDPANGAITLEASVLFPTGSYVLSDAGQDRIDAFLPVYLNVLFSDEYKDYISEVIIEGHTDSVGDYMSNLVFSQQRALSVASYVLDDTYHGISATQKTLLRQRATVNGRSYVDRIMVDGIEDKAASRRVVFKFRLTDEEMIAQIQAILEASDLAPDATPAPTADTSYIPGTIIASSDASSIEKMQRALYNGGWLSSGTKGEFDYATRQAVAQFQAYMNETYGDDPDYTMLPVIDPGSSSAVVDSVTLNMIMHGYR